MAVEVITLRPTRDVELSDWAAWNEPPVSPWSPSIDRTIQLPYFPFVRDPSTDVFVWLFDFRPNDRDVRFAIDQPAISKNVTKVELFWVVAPAPPVLPTAHKPYIYIGGQKFFAPTTQTSGSMIFTENPLTGNDWRGGDFHQLQIGLEGNVRIFGGGNHNVILYELRLEVTHDTSPGSSTVLIRDLPPAIR